MDRYEFSYTDTASGLTTTFGLSGISEDVAGALGQGYAK